MKGWRTDYIDTKCYPTILSLPRHRETNIFVFHFNFKSGWSPNPNTEKEENTKGLPIFSFHVAMLKVYVPSNKERSKRTTTRICHLCSSKKIDNKVASKAEMKVWSGADLGYVMSVTLTDIFS